MKSASGDAVAIRRPQLAAYSITSSAMASSDAGNGKPSGLAALKLMAG